MPEQSNQRELQELQERLAQAERQLADTKAQLAEAQEVVRAIQSGEVDAVIVGGPLGDQVFTLQHAEYAYRALVEAMSEGAATLGRDGTVLYCNRRLSDLLEIPLEQIIGNPIAQSLGGAAEPSFRALLTQAEREGKAKGEIDLRLPEGRRVPAYVSVSRMEAQESGSLCLVFTDLTEQKEREERVRLKRQRFLDMLETLPPMICLLTPDYHVTFANRSFRERFGEPEGRRCFDYLFGLAEPCSFCETYAVLRSGQPHHWERLCPDGETIIDVYSFPFTDVDGSPLVLEMDTDITERRRAERELAQHRLHLESLVAERTGQWEAANAQLQADIAARKRIEQELRTSEERLRVAAQAAKFGSFDADLATGAMYWSAEMREILGVSAEEPVPRAEEVPVFVHPDDRQLIDLSLQRGLDPAGSGALFVEHRVVRRDGSIGWVQLRGRVQFAGSGAQRRHSLQWNHVGRHRAEARRGSAAPE